jgi:uncharacterized repeat protein (TIGR02543 family)
MSRAAKRFIFLVVSLLSGSITMFFTTITPATAGSTPNVQWVVLSGDSSAPTVTVNGVGFGNSPPQGYDNANTSCGSYTNNGNAYGNALNFTDATNSWNAGTGIPPNSACIGLIVQSWTPTKVVFRFGNAYGTFGHWTADQGDSFTLDIEGASFQGTVNYQSHTLSLALAGTGAGSVSGLGISCPGICTQTYTSGMHVTLSALATKGSTFAGWTGACTGTGPCNLVMTSDQAVRATFTPVVTRPTLVLGHVGASGLASTVTLMCNGTTGQVCSGTVTGTVTEHKRASSVVSVTSAIRHRHRLKTTTATVARAAFSLAAPRHETIRIPLNRTGKGLLNRFGRLPVKLSFAGTLSATRMIVFAMPPLHVRLDRDVWFYINVPCNDCYTVAQSVPISGLPRRVHIVVTCTGRGCPFRRRSVTPRGRRVDIASVLRGRHLEPGTKLKLAISAPGRTGETIVYTMRRGNAPLRKVT